MKIVISQQQVLDTSLNITKMAALCGKGTSGEDEVDSLRDSSLLTNDYKVKEELKPMLQAIFQKHGDIATECSLTTVASLSFLLEIVCEIMQTMQAKDFVTLTVMDINDMIVDVRDLQNVNMKVQWLYERVDNIHEAMQLVKRSSSMKQVKDKNILEINETEKQLADYEREMVTAEQKLHSLKENIRLTQEELSAARDEANRINEAHSTAKSQSKIVL